jgi:hypothetical protein
MGNRLDEVEYMCHEYVECSNYVECSEVAMATGSRSNSSSLLDSL